MDFFRYCDKKAAGKSQRPFYQIIFWVLRTLHYRWSSCGQLRKYGKWVPAKELCSLDSRKPFKKGLILNF